MLTSPWCNDRGSKREALDLKDLTSAKAPKLELPSDEVVDVYVEDSNSIRTKSELGGSTTQMYSLVEHCSSAGCIWI